MDAPSFGVGRTQLTKPWEDNNKKILEAYGQYIEDAVKLFNGSYNNLKQDISDMIEFEKKLAQITIEPAERRDRHALYGNKTNLKEFIGNYSDIPLFDIEKDVFRDVNEANITEDSPLIVYDRGYFERLGALLLNTSDE